MRSRSKNIRMDDEGKNYHDSEIPIKGTIPMQLQTDNMFTYDVEYPNYTNKRRDL